MPVAAAPAAEAGVKAGMLPFTDVGTGVSGAAKPDHCWMMGGGGTIMAAASASTLMVGVEAASCCESRPSCEHKAARG